MSDIVHEFAISIDQVQDYEFRVSFDKPHHDSIRMDEPAPLGKDAAPNAARMLAAAIGNCLSASLLFCTSRKGGKIENMKTTVKVQIGRNENKRQRIAGVTVEIDPGTADVSACLATFEDFCTVTASIRQGIPVDVKVKGH